MFRRAPTSLFGGVLAGVFGQSKAAAKKELVATPGNDQANESGAVTGGSVPIVRADGATRGNGGVYASGMDALKSDPAWAAGPSGGSGGSPNAAASATATASAAGDAPPRNSALAMLRRRGHDASAGASNNTANDEVGGSNKSVSTDATAGGSTSSSSVAKPTIATDWMVGAEWASIGDEFKGVDPSKFLKRLPDGYLTPRATMDIQPAEELMADFLAVIEETYKGVDVRDPNTVTRIEGEKPKWLTMGGKVRAVAEFISGHLAHQVSLPVWQEVFDLKHMEMDLMYWLWILHLHIVARRATSVKISAWSRRREVLEELSLTMYASWAHTSEEVMGRPPLSKIRNYVKDMYFVTAVNLEEALMHDGPGGDLALLGVLVKFCPLPRPEDIPLYTYYTLVHYMRFHMALFDRISDEEFSRGNFNFFSPRDPAIFKGYEECQMDEVVRAWRVANAASADAAEAAAAAAAASGSATGGGGGGGTEDGGDAPKKV